MGYKPWYVYFSTKNGRKCISFEEDEQQACFFASQVNGRLMHGHVWEDEEEKSGRA